MVWNLHVICNLAQGKRNLVAKIHKTELGKCGIDFKFHFLWHMWKRFTEIVESLLFALFSMSYGVVMVF